MHTQHTQHRDAAPAPPRCVPHGAVAVPCSESHCRATQKKAQKQNLSAFSEGGIRGLQQHNHDVLCVDTVAKNGSILTAPRRWRSGWHSRREHRQRVASQLLQRPTNRTQLWAKKASQTSRCEALHIVADLASPFSSETPTKRRQGCVCACVSVATGCRSWLLWRCPQVKQGTPMCSERQKPHTYLLHPCSGAHKVLRLQFRSNKTAVVGLALWRANEALATTTCCCTHARLQQVRAPAPTHP